MNARSDGEDFAATALVSRIGRRSSLRDKCLLRPLFRIFGLTRRRHSPTRRRPLVGRRRGLADAYRELGLPDVAVPAALAKGERVLPEKRKLSAWVDELHAPDRPVRPTKSNSTAKSVGRA